VWDRTKMQCACGCGRVVSQNMAEGRRRLYASAACKQRAYRARATACPSCGKKSVLPLRPWVGWEGSCWSCGSSFKFLGPSRGYQRVRHR